MSRKKKSSGRQPLFDKGKRWANYQRRQNLLTPRKTILIVCEGRQTEPNYFNALRDELRNKNIRVRIIPGGESRVTPLYLVQSLATEIQRLDWDSTHDEAWCVFDIEQSGTHTTLQRALASAKKQNYHLAVSNPSFEYWIMLHYERSNREFLNAADVVSALTRYIPNYSKSMSVYSLVRRLTNQAIENAETLRLLCDRHWEDFPNPSTGIDILVKKLNSSI
ncbi:RloB family protein [Leptolinea tardivitalis]|uniref:Abortive phage resistance protein n=1 Tax=Leptolinea tardivitalis TaxID=229920 RepID=A0A0P6WWB7_9CHLR|nr:RloB family protein [Leptolinea tardivitalis]KPL70334.1 hypothetical protein ADM99_14340 [Leptolinea tardivitalis]GAP21897.1 RloB-like protein [Leptolinea tardivitalis]